MDNKKWFLVALAVQVIFLYAWLTLATTQGNGFWAVLWALVASPGLFLLWAYLLESTPVTHGGRGVTLREVAGSVFSHKKQAWSFIYGDLFILPAAFWFAADKWRDVGERINVWPFFWVFSLAFGVIAGAAFHFLLDKPGYTERGYAASLNSPTKLFHDFVSYPVLFGGLLYAFGPLFFTTWFNFHTITILVLVGVWLYLGAKKDAGRADKLVPWGHPLYRWSSLDTMQKS